MSMCTPPKTVSEPRESTSCASCRIVGSSRGRGASRHARHQLRGPQAAAADRRRSSRRHSCCRVRGRLENPSPHPLPCKERGSKPCLSPPLRFGEGAGGGVVSPTALRWAVLSSLLSSSPSAGGAGRRPHVFGG